MSQHKYGPLHGGWFQLGLQIRKDYGGWLGWAPVPLEISEADVDAHELYIVSTVPITRTLEIKVRTVNANGTSSLDVCKWRLGMFFHIFYYIWLDQIFCLFPGRS